MTTGTARLDAPVSSGPKRPELTDDGQFLELIDVARESGLALTERYLAALENVRLRKPDAFDAHVLSIHSVSRVYFARSADEIRRSGRATQPQPLGTSGLWALTNMSGAQKREVFRRILVSLGFPTDFASRAARSL